MSGAPLRNLAMFKKLCGDDCFRNVMLVTTMWDEVDGQEGSQRQQELEQKYWRSMIKLGSRVYPFHKTKESAWDVIGHLPGVHQALLIQKEMVLERKLFAETSAGRVVFYWLADLIALIHRLIEKCKRRTPGTDLATFETGQTDQKAAIRQLEGANEQMCRLTRCAEPEEALEWVFESDPQSPTPPPLQDRERASLYDLHLSRLNTRSSTTSSLAYSEDGVRLHDTGLAATIVALRVASDIADMAPVPGLRGAISVALKVAEMIAVGGTHTLSSESSLRLPDLFQGMKAVQTELVSVAYNAGRLVLIISEHARTGRMPDITQRAINELTR